MLLDNFDSFTYNLVDYFEQLGIKCQVVRNDTDPDKIFEQPFDGLVISPGPEVPGKSGNLIQVLDYYHDKIPVLGICLGHQAIGEYFGGKIVKAQKPMHGKLSKTSLNTDGLFKHIPNTIQVVRYNSLLVDELPDSLKVIGKSETGEIMALRHNTLPLWGVQFHPEAALTEYGLEILKNWLDYNDLTF
nr:aminodeoxychorismate/anthranilate synthase component II [Fulvivirga aurantia]